MIFGAILAGGTGSRMNIADMPKQFLPLGDKPIILHTLEKFLLCDKMDRVYVGVHPDWVGHMQDLLERQVPQRERVILVPGGGDRNSTIFNIVDKIESDWGESDDHLIITHDAVRPFVTLRILEENIEAARTFGACDTVVSAVDTIVVSENGETISQIPDRRLMYQGQTPQSFRISLLKKLYQSLNEEEKAVLTDACKICVVRQTPVRLVEGDVSNLKITTVSDYKIAQAMVGGQVVD
ncbi:IspD/TarI family cytidylyltransferase [Bittarella massiliensis (ex Durand et al. 2017)]|uniref:Ribitol-5-phosphate cytidylyltransferase n=1 Tax=Bittarella massiliensis (ex Durand et al. 2017) TaxID=1720313 RepID=A0AAW5KE30_9FIRM|nr:2-C-methyl-D-erythritol 4-phosphate cytidylyltransferase [Bittarella massiliensis (ex Durand et al. 2017)]MCQ4948500.1 2-C-methyl-D-erythritol 4-phosphate cytidylyltransferase [Bittarella massiliensis (ex Durand et al. 2017)]